MIYRATTNYDAEAYAALTNLMMKRLHRLPRVLVLAMGVLTFAVSGYVITVGKQVSGPALLGLFAGNLLILIGILAPRFVTRLLLAGNGKGGAPTVDYAFSDETFSVAKGAGATAYPYAGIGRVFDLSGFLFFFMKDGQTYILRKAGIQGDANAFEAFLEARVSAARSLR